MITVECRGEQCPIPVVKTIKAIGEMKEADTIQTHVDNETAVQNLTKRDMSELQKHCDRMHAAILAMRRAGMDIMTGQPEERFLAEDLAFHLLLLRISGNALAEKIIANAYRRNQFFGRRRR